MRLDERLVRAAVRLLPPSRRQARREEWLADLEGSTELGLRRSSVALGALRVAAKDNKVRAYFVGVRPRTWVISGAVTVGIVVLGAPAVAIGATIVAARQGVVTVETAPDGSEHTVSWRDYPGVAGVDPQDVLSGPSAEEGLRAGEAMTAEIREALTTEFGLDWAGDPNAHDGPLHPAQNRYGGQSLLVTINAPASQSTSVPHDWDDKQRAIQVIGEVLARYGFGAPQLDQDRWPGTEEDRIRDWGGATPETQVIVGGTAEGPSGQWLWFTFQDLSNDVDGRFAERLGGSIGYGWEPNTISFSYGANALLPEADRAEFERRLAPFAGYVLPEPLPS